MCFDDGFCCWILIFLLYSARTLVIKYFFLLHSPEVFFGHNFLSISSSRTCVCWVTPLSALLTGFLCVYEFHIGWKLHSGPGNRRWAGLRFIHRDCNHMWICWCPDDQVLSYQSQIVGFITAREKEKVCLKLQKTYSTLCKHLGSQHWVHSVPGGFQCTGKKQQCISGTQV